MWTTASAWILARRAEIAGAAGQCLRRQEDPLAEPRFQRAPVDLPRTSEGEGVDEVQFAWGGGGVEGAFDEGTDAEKKILVPQRTYVKNSSKNPAINCSNECVTKRVDAMV